MFTWNSSSTSSSRSSQSGSRRFFLERLPLTINPPKTYGSLLPYYQIVKSTLKYSETLNRSDSMVSLCFRSLVSFINENNLDGFRQFVDGRQAQIDDRDENGCTALMVAATKGLIQFVRILLDQGADPNSQDSDNWSALLCAAKEGHCDVCRLLLENNAEIEHRDMGGWSALMWASYKGRTEVVNLLLENRADVNAHGNFHITSLLWASGRGFTNIVDQLVVNGAKVNMGDKYGTTALIWAARKGHTEIVRLLLRAGANVDTAGMYSWTALLVATQGNHEEIVNLLLEYKPNVNALDKDGCSALTLACKEGYYEIATALINSCNAYINIQDRSGDTNLIHAVKGGHRGVVEALLKKYADVDVAGKDRKTAIYVAVEKGNVSIVKMLLGANPDLEISNKEGDTALLKAVRCRNAEIVQLLLDKKAKVGAADKKGDTALHIAMRARSKAIVEILLRNPKHSHLLYKPNRSGETPYNIDINHQKTILGQIFGARRLNTNEDNENMLGYDLYSSALADVLSEPSLSMPITVGLYAKWGSGKSFLLTKLREEMKNFARQWIDPAFQFSSLLFVVIFHICLILGTLIGLATFNWVFGVVFGLLTIVVFYVFLTLVWFASKRYDWDWPYNFNVKLTRKLNNLRLILQILFCHPPGASSSNQEVISAQPISFYFTDQTRVSSTTGGENSVVQMIGSLYDAIENDYGSLVTRLYRAFKPRPVKSASSWRYRKVCCLPYVLVSEVIFFCFIVGLSALVVFLWHLNGNSGPLEDARHEGEMMTLQIILITSAFILGIAAIANLYTWSKMFGSLIFSQRRHLQRSISKLDTLKSEGFLQSLRSEVNLMKNMVKCLDSLSAKQTRLVIIVDGLDSSDQDKILLVLDTVHMLFSDNHAPFIVILAIDPHVISKAVEINSRRLFSESNIGGHGYLNNMVHLPFYLQNSGLRKFKEAQKTAYAHRKNIAYQSVSNEDSLSVTGRSLSARRLSSENALMSSTEKLSGKYPPRKGSRKLKGSESIASSIGSNLNRIGGAQDLTKMLLTDDYFSDVNPRSMRRLMNVVYITGRLLKAFQIDFSWYRLASWINITEQWPFRTSWIIYHFDTCEESLDDNYSLKGIYDKIRPNIPTIKDIEPLLELDRDEKKFDIFLTFHKNSLLVSDLKIFLPFTINLDPYIKKVIKECQTFEDSGLMMGPRMTVNHFNGHANQWPVESVASNDWNGRHPLNRRLRNANRAPVFPPMPPPLHWQQNWSDGLPPPIYNTQPMQQQHYPISSLSADFADIKLSNLDVEGVCKLMEQTREFSKEALAGYQKVVRENNINGRVLLHCDLEELKKILQMTFGDWELLKVFIICLKEQELTHVMRQNEADKNVRFDIGPNLSSTRSEQRKSSNSVNLKNSSDIDGKIQNDSISSRNLKQSVMEKQVTLEEQMICGALQTLNEEACEDVLEQAEDKCRELMLDMPQEVPKTYVIHPSPENGYANQGETDFVMLQSAGNWQPVSICVHQETDESLSEQNSRCNSPNLADRRGSLKLNFPSGSGKSKSSLKSSKQFDGKNKGNNVSYKQKNAGGSKEELLRVSMFGMRSKSIDASAKISGKKRETKDVNFLHSNPELRNEPSDSESAPLVACDSSKSGFSTYHSSLGISLKSFDSNSAKSPDDLNYDYDDNNRQKFYPSNNLLNAFSSNSISSRTSSLSKLDTVDTVMNKLDDIYCDPQNRD